MPNPFSLGGGQPLNTSQDPSTPEGALTPVPEHYAGVSLPYRGFVDHGVPVQDDFPDVPGYEGSTEVEYVDPDPPQDPIPVRIVQSQTGREFKDWRVGSDFVGNASHRIVGQLLTRTALRIRNIGTQTVFVGPDAATASFSGYPIVVGAELTIDGTGDVWGVSADGSQQEVRYLYEFTVEED